jgi:hypothetical protein
MPRAKQAADSRMRLRRFIVILLGISRELLNRLRGAIIKWL